MLNQLATPIGELLHPAGDSLNGKRGGRIDAQMHRTSGLVRDRGYLGSRPIDFIQSRRKMGLAHAPLLGEREMLRLSAGCATCNRSALRDMCSVSATSTKYLIC